MLYRFCSKFHTLPSSAKILKIGYDLTKLQSLKVETFLRHSVLTYLLNLDDCELLHISVIKRASCVLACVYAEPIIVSSHWIGEPLSPRLSCKYTLLHTLLPVSTLYFINFCFAFGFLKFRNFRHCVAETKYN